MHSESWLLQHLPQLTHCNVPHHLYQDIYHCLRENEGNWSTFDAVAATQRAPTSSPARLAHRKLRVTAAIPLPAGSKVLKIPHEWTFQSAAQAQTQLRQNSALCRRMTTLIGKVIKEDAKKLAIAEDKDCKEKKVAAVMQNLHLLAFSIRVGSDLEDMAYYVLNTLGSSLRENNQESNLKVVPIFCMEQRKLFSIAWTTKDVALGAELVRSCASKIALMGLCKKSYWEARFETEEEFDWYCKYSHIREMLVSSISKTARILVVGTGTSRLPAEMAQDGYSNVVAMDYAANVIAKMQARSDTHQWGVRFVTADLTQMKGWESSSVDCVIDKGCLDAMLLKPETDADDTNWKQVTSDSPDDLSDAKSSMHQLARILKPDGLLVFLTFGNPSNRVHMFDWVAPDQNNLIEWEFLQCLQMSPTNNEHTFVARFFLFVAKKKLK